MPDSATLASKDLLSLASLTPDDLGAIFETAAALKRDMGPFRHALGGKSVILLFEKPSLRTRITFELGPAKMGGTALYFDHSKERIGQRESIRDYARNLERWFDLIVARVFDHAVLEKLAAESTVPVVNALSGLYHPCQALADCFTLHERFGDPLPSGLRVAFIGDGNNVCHSLMHGAALLGIDLTVITPPGHEPRAEVVEEARTLGAATGASIAIGNDPAAVAGASAVYTDTWVSMGDGADGAGRRRAFGPYQVNAALMAAAGPDALFMHCLPAQRGSEVTDDVIDSPASVVYDQAENRLHTQNALMLHMLAPR